MSIASTQHFREANVAYAVADKLAHNQLRVTDRRDEIIEEAAPLPYTTADLLEDATQRWGWTGEQVMSIAQQLFHAGLITYPRTDSHRLSADAQVALQRVVVERFGVDALAPEARRNVSFFEGESGLSDGHSNKRFFWAQVVESVISGRTLKRRSDNISGVVVVSIDDLLETRREDAHEAIRPADPRLSPDEMLNASNEQVQLYRLIWQRSVASQMKPARYLRIAVTLEATSE